MASRSPSQRRRQVSISSVLGVLKLAAQEGLLGIDQAIERLRSTNFRIDPKLLESVLRDTARVS